MILAKQELQRVARYARPVSLLMLDIDYFKNFNDQHGHPAGDQLLCALVELCLKILTTAITAKIKTNGFKTFACIIFSSKK